MEKHFSTFRKHIIGINHSISTFYHKSIPIVYTDWTASGRLYQSIEDKLQQYIFPYVANTHTETNDTGKLTTIAYHKAKEIIKSHVGASDDDVLISSGSGMTGVINKFQRILGLKIHESHRDNFQIEEKERPVVFISHMEHHSNQTSWTETNVDIEIIEADENGLVSIDSFKNLLTKYSDRVTKILSITACSNVTGVQTPYMDMAEIIHQNGGYCFVDFACSAPYVEINMHEDNRKGRYLDAICFSPHKFLGGPGSSGILVFNKKMYENAVPDNSGGGTVEWTNPWGGKKYIESVEVREDGGTPAFLQTIKAAMCCQLKDQMGVENIKKRDNQIIDLVWDELKSIKSLNLLAGNIKNRLPIFSFSIEGLHYNLGVKILNDKFGIQSRGGCSCAGTYGHYLLDIDEEKSKEIVCSITKGDFSTKPGWIRISFHPTTTNEEVQFVVRAIKDLALNHKTWREDYNVNLFTGEITNKKNNGAFDIERHLENCFDFSTLQSHPQQLVESNKDL
ncbi:aminotransferase class V-fold PLP-dependent enzyme [Flavobacteriales bacterium]|nr:aminotransferase class V-fold PLP-dependent enzyme [Flavobacteriales bacterium]